MATHNLKTINPYFSEVWALNKSFEVRENDRGFAVGDVLRLQEWDHENEVYTGREIDVEVTYILDDFREIIRPGYVVMSIGLVAMRHTPKSRTN